MNNITNNKNSQAKIKYTIHGFQQLKLIQHNLSNDDALVLRVIKDMYSSSSIEFISYKKDKFIWVNYTALLNYIPIIGSKSNLMSKIKRFGELGLIERVLKKKRKNKSGNFAYIRPTIELDRLTEYNNDTLIQNLDKDLIQNLDNKDSTNKKDSIKTTTKEKDFKSKDNLKDEKEINKKQEIKITKKEIENIINYFYEKHNGNLDYELVKKLIKIKGIDIVRNCIDIFNDYVSSADSVEKMFFKFCLTWGTKNQFSKNTAYKNNSNNKPAQYQNYEQRKYDDDFFDSLYDNVTIHKE